MAQYFDYIGLGGLNAGTLLPTSGIITNAEKTLVQSPLTDNRAGWQNGVLITAFVSMGISTMTTATFLCRQSTLGTTAVTGNIVNMGGNLGNGTYVASVGTTAATISASGFSGVGPFVMQWVDLTGSFPVPAYNITGSTAAGTGTIQFASVTVQPLGA